MDKSGKNFKKLLQFKEKSGIIPQRGLCPPNQNHTPGDRAPKCPFSGGQRGMIGVEEKQKEK